MSSGKTRSIITVSFFMFILFVIGGCTSGDTNKYEESIIQYDPSFVKTIEKRNTIRAKITLLESGFKKKESEINSSIAVLMAEKNRLKKEFLANADAQKKQLSPEKKEFDIRSRQFEEEKRNKKAEAKFIERDLAEIKSLMDKKDVLPLTQEEIRTWNERLDALVGKKEKLALEIKRIEEEIEINKLKIRVLNI